MSVPDQRRIAKRNLHASLKDIDILLKSKIHEYRFTALELLVAQYERANSEQQKEIALFYIGHTPYINNWDLVDTSVGYIIGPYLFNKDVSLLYKWVKSKNIWERRMSIIATSYFIRQGQFTDTLQLAELLLNDRHDLIHKAVGWMLREIGNRNIKVLTPFLDKHAIHMPRTMLRYSIEKFSPKMRAHYLKMKVK